MPKAFVYYIFHKVISMSLLTLWCLCIWKCVYKELTSWNSLYVLFFGLWGFKYSFHVHHLNAAQIVVLTLEPLAPSLLNYAQLSLLKDSFKHLLWLLMEESTPNALQHTSQSAVRKASNFLLSLDAPYSLAGLMQERKYWFIIFLRQVQYGRLCAENW